MGLGRGLIQYMTRFRFFTLILCLLVLQGIQAQDFGYSKSENDSFISYTFYNKLPIPVTLTLSKKSKLDLLLPTEPIVCSPTDSIIGVIEIPKAFIDADPDFKTSNHFSSSVSYGKQLEDSEVEDVLYELPFQKGKRYKIIQGFNGKFSHSSDQSRYAIDFKIPIGDTIAAARGGRVVSAIEHYTERGGQEFRNKANQVVIYHDDGTLAFYVHLDKDGALVEVGDIVKAGQNIGISGFTGFTTTPHLHFVVRNFSDAIPITFKANKKIGKRSGIWVKNK